MSTSLVTGAGGFIGSHVAEQLVRRGHTVVGMDDLSGGFEENVPKGVEFHRRSILDHEWIEAEFARRRFDYVFHLAAYAAEGLSHFIRRFNYANNLIGSANLVNAAVNHGAKGFVFTSSIAVYGPNQTPMREEMTPQPEDPYGIAKYAVEQDLRAAEEIFGLKWLVFRPHNVYGERQNIADRYRNVVGIFMNRVLAGQSMTVFGDGAQTRAFTHIDDVAPIIARSVEVPEAWGQIFNIGADTPCSVNDLATEVARAMGVTPRIEHLPARHEVLHAFADHAKVRRVFGAKEPIPLRDGIARMAAWVKQAGQRPPVTFKNIEVRKNLPPSWQI